MLKSGNLKLIRKFNFFLIVKNSILMKLMNKTKKYQVGDGRLGHAEDGPYDAIHVGAAAPEIPQSVSKIFKHMITK